MGQESGSTIRPKRSKIVELYTDPPADSTVVCVDELGPVTPRAFPPAPGWSPDGHCIKAPLDYSRGPDKVWVFGALRVEDGKSLSFTSRSRNSRGYLKLLEKIERAIPEGLIYLLFSATDPPLLGFPAPTLTSLMISGSCPSGRYKVTSSRTYNSWRQVASSLCVMRGWIGFQMPEGVKPRFVGIKWGI